MKTVEIVRQEIVSAGMVSTMPVSTRRYLLRLAKKARRKGKNPRGIIISILRERTKHVSNGQCAK